MREGNRRSTTVHSQPYVLIFNGDVQLYRQKTHTLHVHTRCVLLVRAGVVGEC